MKTIIEKFRKVNDLTLLESKESQEGMPKIAALSLTIKKTLLSSPLQKYRDE